MSVHTLMPSVMEDLLEINANKMTSVRVQGNAVLALVGKPACYQRMVLGSDFASWGGGDS